MPVVSLDPVLESIRESAFRVTGEATDFDPLLDLVGEAQFVLIGEASHGTQEFYRARAELTRRLIVEKNFAAVAVEADWPDAYRVNRYVRGLSADTTAERALSDFRRFPTWMWRNTEVLDFVEWLRGHNAAVGKSGQVGFYGLDLYSLSTSIHAVLDYLDRVDPAAARRARYRYSCFEDRGEETHAYGHGATFGISESCEREVVEQLKELQRRAAEYSALNGDAVEDEFFFAEQNARLVKNAEQYYRSMFRGQVESWNLRDRHMAETLQNLVDHLKRQANPPKVAVWAHNSHLGDARATQMGLRGECSLGQLVRERYDDAAVLIGFTTYTGTVTVASEWDGPTERKRVRPALEQSYEHLLHECGLANFLLLLRDRSFAVGALRKPRLERAIGVIYRPETERVSHYFDVKLPDQFDAVIHFDQSHAVQPLEQTALWVSGELPETFPTGL